jgi:hypothetical protein
VKDSAKRTCTRAQCLIGRATICPPRVAAKLCWRDVAASANKQHWHAAEKLSSIPPKKTIKPVPMPVISLGRCLARMMVPGAGFVCVISGQ